MWRSLSHGWPSCGDHHHPKHVFIVSLLRLYLAGSKLQAFTLIQNVENGIHSKYGVRENEHR